MNKTEGTPNDWQLAAAESTGNDFMPQL